MEHAGFWIVLITILGQQQNMRSIGILIFKKRKKRVNIPIPSFYFFFAGAFLSSFFAGFLATVLTLGI